jgi:hypothetical protein
MSHHVDEIIGREPVIHRYDDGTQLRNRIELFEVLMRIGRDGGDAVALRDTHPRQASRPPVTALAELTISEPELAVDHGFARGI